MKKYIMMLVLLLMLIVPRSSGLQQDFVFFRSSGIIVRSFGKNTVGSDCLNFTWTMFTYANGPYTVPGTITLLGAHFFARTEGYVRVAVYSDDGNGNPQVPLAEYPPELCLADQWHHFAPLYITTDKKLYHIVFKMSAPLMAVADSGTGHCKWICSAYGEPFPTPYGTPWVMNRETSVYITYIASDPLPLSCAITPKYPRIYVEGTGEPDSVILTATVQGGTSPYTYEWALNGTPISGANTSILEFKSSGAGTRQVTCNIVDSEGAPMSNSVNVKVIDPPLPETIHVGFENPEDFHTPESGLEIWANQESMMSVNNPNNIFEPAIDVVHSGNQSAKLTLLDPTDEESRRIHIYHQWNPLYAKNIWFECWIYLPTGFPEDNWTHFYNAYEERWFEPGVLVHGFDIGISITAGGKVGEGEYKLETILNHGRIDVDHDGVNDLGPKVFVVSPDTVRFGEWFKITTYIYRDIDQTKGIYRCWLNDVLQWDLNCRTIGIPPEIIASKPSTGPGERAWCTSGISLYCGDLPCTPKYAYYDDVMLSTEITPPPPV